MRFYFIFANPVRAGPLKLRKRTFQNINQENYGQRIFSTSFIDYPKDVQLFLTMAIATDRLILQGP